MEPLEGSTKMNEWMNEYMNMARSSVVVSRFSSVCVWGGGGGPIATFKSRKRNLQWIINTFFYLSAILCNMVYHDLKHRAKSKNMYQTY